MSIQNKILQDYGYEVIKLIGKTNFSSVYLCRKDKELFAVKIIRNNETYLVDSINKEYKILSELCHKNVVKVYEYLESNDFCMLIMEYIRGKSLYDISYIDKIKACIEIASLFVYLHQKNIYHLDLKIENILYNKSPVLIDFGASISSEYLDINQATISIMPHEIVDGNYKFVDIYQFGYLLKSLFGGGRFKDLSNLANLCMNTDYKSRPSFELVRNEIKSISNKMRRKRKLYCILSLLLLGLSFIGLRWYENNKIIRVVSKKDYCLDDIDYVKSYIINKKNNIDISRKIFSSKDLGDITERASIVVDNFNNGIFYDLSNAILSLNYEEMLDIINKRKLDDDVVIEIINFIKFHIKKDRARYEKLINVISELHSGKKKEIRRDIDILWGYKK